MKLLEKNQVLKACVGPTPGCQEFQEERNYSERQGASWKPWDLSQVWKDVWDLDKQREEGGHCR